MSRLGRIARVCLAASLLLSWTGAIPVLAQREPAQGDGSLTPRGTQALAMIKRLCEVAELRLSKPGTDPTDVSATAAGLGHDPLKVFRFVRDAIAYEPYRGSLRGPVGALVGMAANGTDKAALLAVMLRSGGQEARVVTGRLPADKAQALVAQFLGRDPLKGILGQYAEGAPADPTVLQELAQQTGFEPEKINEWLEQSRKQYAVLRQDALDSTNANHAYLAGLVKQNNITLGRPADAWKAELVARAADHTWVQVKDPAGAWVDYDPSFADAEPGTKHAEGTPIEKSDAGQRHRVQFQLIYSYAEGTETKSETLIDHTIYVDEAWAYPPQFRIAPSDPLPSFDDTSTDPQKALEMMKKIKKYQPVLRVGRKFVAGKPFDLEGNTFDVDPADGRIKGAAAIGGAAGGLFGGAFGGGDEKPSRQFAQLNVLMTMHSPGADPRPQQRTLLRLADITGDHMLSPILGWEMLLHGQPISGQASEYGTLRKQLAIWRPALPLFEKKAVEKGDLQRLAGIDPEPYPELLVSLAQLRQVGMAERVKKSAGVVPLIDRPQLAISEQRFCMNMTTGHACSRAAIDIVENAISFIPTNGNAGSAAADAAMWQGVFDTVAEAAIMQGAASLPVGSAVVATERGRIRKAGAFIARPDGIDQLPPAALPADERNWIKQFEPKSRQILVVDAGGDAGAQAVPAWWTLDPETGAMLGRSVGGRGAALTEYQMTAISYGICLLQVMYDYGRNVQKNGVTGKQSAKTIAGLLGCFASYAGGILKPSNTWLIMGMLWGFAVGVFGTELDVN